MSSPCRQREERAPQGPPPFAGIELPERRCASPDCPVPGGAVLSRFNTDSEGLCWQCRAAGRRSGLARRFARADERPAVRVWEVVAALLLLQRNLHPDEPLYLREALAGLGVEVTREDVKNAIRCCERRGMVIEGEQGRAGQVLTEWRFPFTRRRGRRG